MAWAIVPVLRTSIAFTDSSRRLWCLPVPDGSIGELSRKIIATGIPSLTQSEMTDIWDLYTKPTSESGGGEVYFPGVYEYFPVNVLGRYFPENWWASGTGYTAWSVAAKDTETWSLVTKPS